MPLIWRDTNLIIRVHRFGSLFAYDVSQNVHYMVYASAGIKNYYFIIFCTRKNCRANSILRMQDAIRSINRVKWFCQGLLKDIGRCHQKRGQTTAMQSGIRNYNYSFITNLIRQINRGLKHAIRYYSIVDWKENLTVDIYKVDFRYPEVLGTKIEIRFKEN